MKYKALGVIGAVLLVLLMAPSTLGQDTTGGEVRKVGSALLIWGPYIGWSPPFIPAGSETRLSAGISVISFGVNSLRYSIRVVVYDPYPVTNGRPEIISNRLLFDCSPGSGFRFDYDYARRAWVFDSGICSTQLRGFYNNFGITASWRPRVAGTYRAEVIACVHEQFGGGCESRSATLIVLRWRLW